MPLCCPQHLGPDTHPVIYFHHTTLLPFHVVCLSSAYDPSLMVVFKNKSRVTTASSKCLFGHKKASKGHKGYLAAIWSRISPNVILLRSSKSSLVSLFVIKTNKQLD
jgi:hypothetical protein